MTVTINKTDGTVLTTIADGAIDTSSTNIALIGRLYRNYGELVNENLVKMLENFAATSSPTTPMIGQLWYNKATKNIQVYRDTGFVPLARITSSSAEPSNASVTDLWWDLNDEQLRMYNGANWLTISPLYTAAQGKTGMFAETIRDTTLANHIAIVAYQQGQQITIFSKDADYVPQTAIGGFPVVKKGITLSNIANFKLNGTATNSDALDDISSEQFLRSDENDSTSGTLTVANDSGLFVGADSDIKISVDSTTGKITKVTAGSLQFIMGTDLAIVINDSEQLLMTNGSAAVPSLSFISNATTGVFTDNNGESFDITVLGVKKVGVDATGVEIANNLLVNSNLNVNGNSVFGNNVSDLVTFTNGTLSIPNDLIISNGDVDISQNLTIAGDLTVSGTTVTVEQDLFVEGVTSLSDINVTGDVGVTGATVINGTLSVTPTDSNDFKIDSLARVMVNATSPATGYTNEGDITMGATNAIFARNIPKYVVTFNGTLAGLAIYKSHHIATVTRTTPGNYSLTLRDDNAVDVPLISAYPTVVGSANGASAVGKSGTSSIGDTSINIQTSTGSDYTQISVAIWDGAN